MFVGVNHGHGLGRIQVERVLHQWAIALRFFPYLHRPSVEVVYLRDGPIELLVCEHVVVKPPLHPFKVIERHKLQSIDLRTDR